MRLDPWCTRIYDQGQISNENNNSCISSNVQLKIAQFYLNTVPGKHLYIAQCSIFMYKYLLAAFVVKSINSKEATWVYPKIGVPQNGWFSSWKTLWTNGWFGGFVPLFLGWHPHVQWAHWCWVLSAGLSVLLLSFFFFLLLGCILGWNWATGNEFFISTCAPRSLFSWIFKTCWPPTILGPWEITEDPFRPWLETFQGWNIPVVGVEQAFFPLRKIT